MSQRHKVIAATFMLFKKRNTFFFVKRKNTGFADGKWGLVAGHVEPNETLAECAIRESKEEAGIKITKDNLELVHVCSVNTLYGGVPTHALHNYFRVIDWIGEPINIEQGVKSDGCKWLDPYKNRREIFVPAERHVFDEIKKGSTYSEFNYLTYSRDEIIIS